LKLRLLTLEEFKPLSEEMHKKCFSDDRPAWSHTCDFVLVADDADTEKPLGFLTCFEIDKGQVWIHFGGVFKDNIPRNALVDKYTGRDIFNFGINYLLEQYATILLDTKNTNIPMIKIALSTGFLIVGVECSFKEIYLRMILENNE